MENYIFIPKELLKEGILIVDDDINITDSYRRFLKNKGFENIFTANTTHESFEILSKYSSKISILILDWILDNDNDCRKIINFINERDNYYSAIFMSVKLDLQKEYCELYTQNSKIYYWNFYNEKNCQIMIREIIKILIQDSKKKKIVEERILNEIDENLNKLNINEEVKLKIKNKKSKSR